MKHKSGDIDLDFGDRNQALSVIDHVPASIWRDDRLVPHTSGVYVCDMPVDGITGLAGLDHQLAEELGYVKIDFLNNSVYRLVKSPEHLDQLLLKDPPWYMLKDRSFVEKIVHINRHWKTLQQMPEPVNSIPRMAMFLAIIRPGKKHLIGKSWAEIAKTVWDREVEGYTFRQSHALAYSMLVTLHMVLVKEIWCG